MENFSNSIVLPQKLPEIDKTTFNPLDKKQLNITYIRSAIVYFVMTAAYVAFLFISGENIPKTVSIIIISILTALVVLSVTFSILAFPRKGYLIREKDISFQRGLIIYKLTTVPFNRIQHVEVIQGFLPGLFKLSAVKIYTAGGSSSDLFISGLPEEVAKSLKAFLSERISEYKSNS
ncbi:MAG: PH domain-containing protein [Cyclobacteriaceae bacterium]